MIRKQSQKGFTIIEVVLVLAIAALIFLIVFLAVPALQRSQRDTQRRSDVGRLVTSVTNYVGNHQGSLPTTVDAAYLNKYLRVNTDKFSDPRLGDYNITAGVNTTTPAASATFNGASANGVDVLQGRFCLCC
jgi:prepilin-type N-terminal cleavage/methylation domain-containing protein